MSERKGRRRRRTQVSDKKQSASKKPKVTQPNSFGKSGTRTVMQKQVALSHARQLVASAQDGILCFTDGACKGNPGPAGSAVWIPCIEDGLAQFLGHSTNNKAEVTAIKMNCLRLIDILPWIVKWQEEKGKECQENQENHERQGEKEKEKEKEKGEIDQLEKEDEETARPVPKLPLAEVHLFTDSKYAEGVLVKGQRASANAELVEETRWLLTMLSAICHVNLRWIPGHTDEPGNKTVDEMAREVMAPATQVEDCKQEKEKENEEEKEEEAGGLPVSAFRLRQGIYIIKRCLNPGPHTADLEDDKLLSMDGPELRVKLGDLMSQMKQTFGEDVERAARWKRTFLLALSECSEQWVVKYSILSKERGKR